MKIGWPFVFYAIAWQAMVWIGGMYVILGWGWSHWWVLLLIIMSGCQMEFTTK